MIVKVTKYPGLQHSEMWEKKVVRRQSVSSTKVIIGSNGSTTTISYTMSVSISKVGP
jgi:hypothetical protein